MFDIEIDPMIGIMTVIAATLCDLIIWFSSMWGAVDYFTKVVITILSYPIIYFCLMRVLNK